MIGVNPRIALEDIVVFKVMLWDHQNGKYTTPVMNTPVDMYCKTGIITGAMRVLPSDGRAYYVDRGVHSFLTTKNGLEMVQYCRQRTRLHPILFKAIIPKGTLYFIGMNGDIVSAKLVIKPKDNPIIL